MNPVELDDDGHQAKSDDPFESGHVSPLFDEGNWDTAEWSD